MQNSRYSEYTPETKNPTSEFDIAKELSNHVWLEDDDNSRTRVYKEWRFDKKLIRERYRALNQSKQLSANESVTSEFQRMSRREMLEIIRRAKLTRYQRQALTLRCLGHSYGEMSRLMNCSRQFCCKSYLAALKRLKPAIESFPYLGLSEVYRQEQMRGSSW